MIVLAGVIGFVPMVTVAVEADTSGTGGNTVDNSCLGYVPADSVGVAGVLVKSFDCHCGVEPE